MNQDDQSNRDESLSPLLQMWREETPLPPRFAEGVWCRIATREVQASSRPGLLDSLVRWWELATRRPAFAVVYLGGFLAIGLTVGFWQAEHYAHSTELSWRTAYVQSVSPSIPFRP